MESLCFGIIVNIIDNCIERLSIFSSVRNLYLNYTFFSSNLIQSTLWYSQVWPQYIYF